jgi:hypothetical protein
MNPKKRVQVGGKKLKKRFDWCITVLVAVYLYLTRSLLPSAETVEIVSELRIGILWYCGWAGHGPHVPAGGGGRRRSQGLTGPTQRGEHQVLGSADPDPGSGAFLTPGSGIGFFRIPDLGSWIPNPYFWELSDNVWGKKFYNSLKLGPKFFV